MKPLYKLIVLAAVLCASCDPETESLTQVQVVVRSDLEIGTQLKSLKLELFDADGEEVVHGGPTIPLVKRDPAEGEQTLPLSFGIVPAGGDAGIRFLLKVRGYGPLEEGGRDEEIVRESVLTGFLPGETTVIYVFLGSQCLQKLCDSDGGGSLMSCDYQTGMCSDVDFEPPVRAPEGPTVDPIEVGCMRGFTRKDGDCVDIDECEADNDEPPCGSDAECQNHAGGYRCWCSNNGYVESDMDCTFDEEIADVCDPDPCEAPGTCTEFDGDFLCECPSGYDENVQGVTTCDDLDECELGTDGCDPLSTCRNTPGSFVCEDCPDGYEDPEPGDTACIEISSEVDECELGTDDCDPLSECRDTADGYVCENCPAGYDDPAAGDTECIDIDECDLDIDNCDPALTCMNTVGSFQCTGCESGYVDPAPGDTSCVDVDECEINTDGCDAVATCVDTDGSFQCDCPDEYEDPDPGMTGCILIEDDCVVRVSSTTGSDADDGSTWPLAKQTIDAALAVPDVCQVWVAAGVYKPIRDATGATPTDAREVTFALKPDVAVYGGFIGTETDHKQGDVLANPTILSGNIGAAGSSDNAYHIVTGAAGATLGNFFIMGGLASGTSPNNQGAGMINNAIAGQVTLEDLIFVDNRANFGGGVANRLGTQFTVDNTVFLWNHANNAGAGLSASTMVSPTEFTAGTVTSTTFYGNTGNFGVGLWTNQSLVHIRNSTFNSNATNPTASSGALDFAAIPTGATTEHSLINSTFINNIGVKGAAVWVDSNSPDIIGCSFINNTSDTSAAVATRELAPVARPQLLNCLFWNNTRAAGAQTDVSAEEGGAPFVDTSCGRQTLDDLGAGNANVLLGAASPFTTVVPSGLAFLNQSTTAPTCIDAASTIHASDAAIEWSALTTAADGELDMTAPDAGRHVSPNAVAITAIAANGTTLSWTATNAASCAWLRHDDYIPHAVDPITGSAAHGNAPSGTRIALICRGQEGEPAVAAATVP